MMLMRARLHRADAGFTLFELAVVVAVVAILSTVLLSRLSFYTQTARQLAFNQTLAALRAQVKLEALELMIARRPEDIAALAGKNPFNWLVQKPANYLGEMTSPNTKKLDPDNWFFDKNDGKLVYLLSAGNIFSSEGSELLKFKVSLKQVPPTATEAGDALTLEAMPSSSGGAVAAR
ncbi:prepilin-type N-terminal cleavage/methylation domain-containing protein [Janthinobacterium aquaticum]|uniref:prepilin-type N-terminal cleavage/methylation domain-containing protein n=1 Tax=Janthinobacterium sp. FT58W TaxID=2654254 RepID=UPI0012641531|nr:prepilin-type N-terminal cleavage/methylation domain-containing protein [Janthinobacterium sp. FT58W]KAB8045003.1 prepilin-type N-terminal cleavage/methylation domain-containing protein [Janthinobacterium sp. FT58W]